MIFLVEFPLNTGRQLTESSLTRVQSGSAPSENIKMEMRVPSYRILLSTYFRLTIFLGKLEMLLIL